MTVNASLFNPDPRLAPPPTLALAANATRYIKKVFQNQALCTGLKPAANFWNKDWDPNTRKGRRLEQRLRWNRNDQLISGKRLWPLRSLMIF